MVPMSMRTLAVLLMLLLGLTGCGDRHGDERQTEPSDHGTNGEGSAASAGQRILASTKPWEPVWAEGTAYSDSSRTMTIVARTVALEAIVARNRAVHGDSLRGMISVRFVIYPDGTVGNVELLEDEWNVDSAAGVTDSLLAHLEQWTFPPGAPRPVALTQPWKFQP